MAEYYRFESSSRGGRRLVCNARLLRIKRVVEFVAALFLTLLTAPAWYVSRFMNRATTVQHTEVYDAQGRALKLALTTQQGSSLSASHRLFRSVLKGRLALVGAAPVATTQEKPLSVTLGIKPGIYSTYSLKQQANLTGLDQDYELLFYINTASLKVDLGILLRSLLGHLFHSGPKEKPGQIEMLGVRIDNLDQQSALNWIAQQAKDHASTTQLAFVNPDCLNIATRNREYRERLNQADRVFADGIGVHLGCNMLDLAMRSNLNGTDLFPLICELAQAEELSIYLLGGRPGVTETMISKLAARFPALRIAGHRHGYFTAADEAQLLAEIRNAGADILLVAFGAPKQELWIAAHRDQLGVGLAVGVGGLFDFISERIPRAPLWMREVGLEWLYRLIQEPGRMWKRYVIGNPLFLYRVWRQKRKSLRLKRV